MTEMQAQIPPAIEKTTAPTSFDEMLWGDLPAAEVQYNDAEGQEFIPMEDTAEIMPNSGFEAPVFAEDAGTDIFDIMPAAGHEEGEEGHSHDHDMMEEAPEMMGAEEAAKAEQEAMDAAEEVQEEAMDAAEEVQEEVMDAAEEVQEEVTETATETMENASDKTPEELLEEEAMRMAE
jgi:gas vesicle protein